MPVLYRKYRPRQFSQVVGQQHVVQTLLGALKHGSFGHAYLFYGPRGSGKTTLARLLAKAVNCQQLGKDGEPCDKCTSCEAINHNAAIDLIEIDAASHRGIDEMRSLKEGIILSPSQLKYKVYIIDEAHQLTKEAANALLKTLEEPPAHAVFVLATTEIHKMLSTIVSRCQQFEFKLFNLEQIIGRLNTICVAEKVSCQPAALELIAVNSGGSLRDAEGLLEQVLTFARGQAARDAKITVEEAREALNVPEVALISQLVDLIAKRELKASFALISELMAQGKDVQEFAKGLINYLRQALILRINPQITNPLLAKLTEAELARLHQQVKQFSEAELVRILNLLIEAENKQRYSSLPQLPLELALVDIITVGQQ